MSTTLVITSSVLGANSASGRLVEETVTRLRDHDPSGFLVRRDLDREPVPHLDSDAVAAFGAVEPSSARQASARALSDRLVAEVVSADTIVIGAPMYNFGIPSTLKAWFDHVLRSGITFRYTDAGSEGLLKGKRAFVVLARGGIYDDEQRVHDSQEPHLRTLLGFIGIDDVSFIRADGLALGEEARSRGMDAARAQIARMGPTRLRAA